MKLKAIVLLVIIAGCSVLLSGCLGGSLPPRGWSGPAVYNGSLYIGTMEGRIITIEDLETYGKKTWSYPDETSLSYFYGSPFVVDDTVYAGAYSGNVYAFTTLGLNKFWVYPAEDNLDSIVGGPVVADGILYFGCSDGNLYAVNASNGLPAWDSPFHTEGKIWATPLVHDGVVYISSFDHNMYALNASDGTEIWNAPFEARGAIAATPVLYNGSLYFGSLDRRFYAVDTATGEEKGGFTPYQAHNWFWAKAVAYNGSIITGSMDGYIYALDADSGSLLWSTDAGGSVRGDLALVQDLVIAGTEAGTVVALRADDGEQSWSRTLGEPPSPVRAPLYGDINTEGNGVVYVHATNQKVYAIETEFGNTLWSVSTGGE